MTTTIKKLTNAEKYEWAGIGGRSTSTAATYGVFRDGVQVAEIARTSGGGYMEKALWECRNSVTQSYKCMFTKTEKTAKPGELVLASGPTLAAVKAKITA